MGLAEYRGLLSQDPTVGGYLDAWLTVQRTQLQASPWHSYTTTVERYLRPALVEIADGQAGMQTLPRGRRAVVRVGRVQPADTAPEALEPQHRR